MLNAYIHSWFVFMLAHWLGFYVLSLSILLSCSAFFLLSMQFSCVRSLPLTSLNKSCLVRLFSHQKLNEFCWKLVTNNFIGNKCDLNFSFCSFSTFVIVCSPTSNLLFHPNRSAGASVLNRFQLQCEKSNIIRSFFRVIFVKFCA